MKRCGRCGEVKAYEDYGYRNKTAGVRHTICKTCHAAYRVAYVERLGRDVHHANIVAWTASQRSARRSAVLEYLAAHPCVDCGEGDPRVLDFDHVRDVKSAAISAMIRDRRPMRAIWDEIAKCDVRCANCHRRRTALTLWRTAERSSRENSAVASFVIEEGLAARTSD